MSELVHELGRELVLELLRKLVLSDNIYIYKKLVVEIHGKALQHN